MHEFMLEDNLVPHPGYNAFFTNYNETLNQLQFSISNGKTTEEQANEILAKLLLDTEDFKDSLRTLSNTLE